MLGLPMGQRPIGPGVGDADRRQIGVGLEQILFDQRGQRGASVFLALEGIEQITFERAQVDQQ